MPKPKKREKKFKIEHRFAQECIKIVVSMVIAVMGFRSEFIHCGLWIVGENFTHWRV